MTTISVARRRKIAERDGWRCVYCGSEVTFDLWDHQMHQHRGESSQRAIIDHVVPISQGGKRGLANEVLACFLCNSRKRDRLLCDWLESENCRVPRWRSFGNIVAPEGVAA